MKAFYGQDYLIPMYLSDTKNYKYIITVKIVYASKAMNDYILG